MVSGEGAAACTRVRQARCPGAGAPQEGSELGLVMSLHVAAAIHCGLGRHADSIPVLECAAADITPPPPVEGDGYAVDENHHQQLLEIDQRGEKSLADTTTEDFHVSLSSGGGAPP